MAQTQYTGKNALTYVFTLVKQFVTGQVANKVDKVEGKGLSTNDYTTTEKEKLQGIEAGAQVNKLEQVSVNGAVQQITEKGVNLTVPTKISDLTDDSDFVETSEMTTELAKKQDKLTAGSNISIQDGVISASGEILNSVAFANITGNIADNVTLQGAFDSKADEADLTDHIDDSKVHVTMSDKDAWNGKTTMREVEAKGYQTAENVETAITAKGYTTMTEVEGKGYQTSTQVESTITAKGYQTESQVSALIAEALDDITGFEYQVVAELPQSGEKGIIYLVAHEHGEGDGYDEYIYVNNAFEKIGNTDIDLSGYVLTTDLVEITNEEVQNLWDTAGL